MSSTARATNPTSEARTRATRSRGRSGYPRGRKVSWDVLAAHKRYSAGESMEDVAADVGVSRWALWCAFKKRGLARRAPGRRNHTHCSCGKPTMKRSTKCYPCQLVLNNAATRRYRARRRAAAGLPLKQVAVIRKNGYTPKEWRLARHALGLPNANKVSYRNRFMAGGADRKAWLGMVARGFAETDFVPHVLQFFRLTKAGALAALEPGERLSAEDFGETRD